MTITWSVATPLGHDESQYAIAATETLAGEPARWFYLSRGMNAVAIPGVLLGGSELALRLLPMLLGVGFVLATYLLGRRAVGPLAAAWAIVMLACSRNAVRLGTDLLSDIPAAACLLAALALIVDEVDRPEGVRWRIVALAPLFAAAFYVRYGSVIPIAVIVGASILVGARTLARRPLPVLVTAALFLVLLVPHFLEARALSGSVLGILRWSREVPNDLAAESGLITYLTSNPIKYYGMLTPFVLVAGVLAGVPALLARDRRRLLGWVTGIGTFVAMGLTTHGMFRYILVPVAIMLVLGTDLILRGFARLPTVARRYVGVAIVVALAWVWFLTVRRQFTADDFREYRMRGTLAAVHVIRNDAHGAPCIVIGAHNTQLEWYSGCRAPLILDGDSARDAQKHGKRVYVVFDYTPTWSKRWAPDLASMPGTPHILYVSPDALVIRFDP